MKNKLVLLTAAFMLLFSTGSNAQVPGLASLLGIPVTPANVDYDAFEQLVKEVKEHRKTRLVSIDSFASMSRQPNVVILDTRSDSMYKKMHIKGAIHLNFSDFTQENLVRLIPDPNTRILIYCNNNFSDDARLTPVAYQALFPAVVTKAAIPRYFEQATIIPDPKLAAKGAKAGAAQKNITPESNDLSSHTAAAPATSPGNAKPLTLALNIPTYINLYGYGYKNVYELSELVYMGLDPRIQYEGTDVPLVPVQQANVVTGQR